MLRQVVVGWKVLLIEVQAVALSLEAKLLVQDHEGHVLTTALLGSSTLWGGGGGGGGGGCGNGEEDSCTGPRTGTGTGPLGSPLPSPLK